MHVYTQHIGNMSLCVWSELHLAVQYHCVFKVTNTKRITTGNRDSLLNYEARKYLTGVCHGKEDNRSINLPLLFLMDRPHIMHVCPE